MKVKVADLEFEKLIDAGEIASRITHLGEQLNIDYKDKTPVFIGVLSGSFLFIADLVKHVDIPCEVTFTKLASYYGGTATSGKIREDIDLSVDITNRDIIIIEDIIDSGNTISYLIEKLYLRKPKSIKVCTLLFKPMAVEISVEELAYVGFNIPNEFVVGYGLDYKELGRNLNDIYKKVG